MLYSLRPVVSALLVGLILAGSRAQAGHYTTSYTYTFAPPAGTYGQVSATNTTASPSFAQVAYGSGTMTLSVTPSLAWTPDAQGDTSTGPPMVSYVEAANISMQIKDVASPPAGVNVTAQTASDDIGNTVTHPAPPGYGVLCTDYKPTSAGSPGPLTARTVTSTFTYSTQDSISSGGGAVGYTVYPVYITLTGQNSSNQALTGQQIQATLAMPAKPDSLPPGTKIMGYTWSFTGGTKGNPIKNWDPNGVVPGTQTPQQLFPLTASDLSQTDTSGNGLSSGSFISFYDEIDKDAVTAKCVVSLTFPDGTAGSVTATSAPVTFLKPTAVWKVETGNVYYSHANDAYGLYPAFGTGFPGGVYWHDVVVTVPTPFSGGTCCFTQLAQPNHQYNGTGVGPNNNANSLDNSFEYFNYSWAAGSAGTENDSPAIQVGPGNKIGDTTTANDTLQAWLMYQPTGGIWVPLQKYTYTWTVTLIWVTPGTWSVSGQNPAPPNPGPAYTPTATDTPPQWTTILANRE